MTLSFTQNKFLARRLLTKTDEAAVADIGVSVGALGKWKREDAEFRAAYEDLGKDGVELARAILRQHLGQAAITLTRCMDAKDETDQINAAAKVLESHGVIKQLTENTQTGELVIRIVRDEGKPKTAPS